MIVHSKNFIYWLAFCLAALVLAGCGGNSTYSPTVANAPSVVAVSITTANATTFPTGSVQLQAVVTGTSNQAVTWSVVSQNGGSITSSGLYTAPADDDVVLGKTAAKKTRVANVQYTVQAVSVADPTKSATATVTVVDLTVTVTPADPTVVEGGTIQFTGTVTGPTTNKTVRWYVNSLGTVTQSGGLYTAPLVPGTYQVLCYSNAQNGDMGFTDITVVPPSGISVSINPPSADADLNEQIQFTATVTGTTNQAVTWSVLPVGQQQYGSITSTGLFTSPGAIPFLKVKTRGESELQLTVQATSVADPSKSATATVTVFDINSTPGPAAMAPFAAGLLIAWRRRKKQSH